MFKSIITAAAIVTAASTASAATTALEDYSFDFATMGYQVEFEGFVKTFSEPLENGDYVWLTDGGYRVKTSFDALSRQGKRDLTQYFNDNCVVGFGEEGCEITAEGEVQLTDDMQVILITRSVVLDGVAYK